MKPEVEAVDLDGVKKYTNPRDAANKIKADLLAKYFEGNTQSKDGHDKEF